MKHGITVQYAGIRLRPVAMWDAEFIFRLRRHPELAKYLGEFSENYEDHLAWLKAYFEREGDYYFCIELAGSGKPVGTIAIYNRKGQVAEWGRIIIDPRFPAAPASVLLLYGVAFDTLGLERVYCRTVKDNRHAVSFHDNCGAERTGIEAGGITIRGRRYDMVVHQVTRARWPDVRNKLEPAAKLAQRFLEEANRMEDSM